MKKYLRPYYAKEKNIFQKNQTQKKRLELALKKIPKKYVFYSYSWLIPLFSENSFRGGYFFS